ncbi:hypothetical protein K7432_007052 [Basidiobolus ranarum]|uniref:Uncharacterized protein n=1 Tax=Basidiobolus ranarum TaxID=34480 RepID=A0ABR2WU43_9FUNG
MKLSIILATLSIAFIALTSAQDMEIDVLEDLGSNEDTQSVTPIFNSPHPSSSLAPTPASKTAAPHGSSNSINKNSKPAPTVNIPAGQSSFSLVWTTPVTTPSGTRTNLWSTQTAALRPSFGAKVEPWMYSHMMLGGLVWMFWNEGRI